MAAKQCTMELKNKANFMLVVGGTGFIGQHFINEAINNGFNITVLSINEVNTNNKHKDIAYISADISNKEILQQKLKGSIFNYVINLGGYIDHSNFSTGGNDVFNSHFIGLKNLIECIDKSRLVSFIQIGSSDEYGNNLAPQNENQREDPISPYSIAKVASTHFLQTLYKTEKFPVVILRLFLVYGPRQSKNRFIPQLIDGCQSNIDFSVSSAVKIRDFCYVSDIANAILISLKSKNAFGEVINIASGFAISIKDIVEIVQSIIGSGNPIYGELVNRCHENMQLYADISKAKKLLNWEPKVHIKEGLIKTISLTSESDKN